MLVNIGQHSFSAAFIIFSILAKMSVSLIEQGQIVSDYISGLRSDFKLFGNLTNTFYNFPKTLKYLGPLICSFVRDP